MPIADSYEYRWELWCRIVYFGIHRDSYRTASHAPTRPDFRVYLPRNMAGSYDSIFYGLAGIVVALGVGLWLVRLPSRTPREIES
jgi:hypothetical protein